MARVSAATHAILSNIPGLDGVLQILGHGHRRFDSVAMDGMLPIGARMLRIATDFDALERANPCPGTALKTMRARTGIYDTDLLETFAGTVGRGATISAITAHDPREAMTHFHGSGRLQPGVRL
jgi:hypothetical protein